MHLIKAGEGTVYQAPNHFNFWGIRKFGPPDGSAGLNVSISEFLPNGGGEMTASDKERIYCVMRGTMTVKSESGTAYDMVEGDMIYIPPGEKREMIVTGSVACRVLVIVSPPSPK